MYVAVASWDRSDLSSGRSGFDSRRWRMAYIWVPLNLHFVECSALVSFVEFIASRRCYGNALWNICVVVASFGNSTGDLNIWIVSDLTLCLIFIFTLKRQM